MIVAISPHFDDAVFSCGQWLATHPGSHVITLFGGIPQDRYQRTAWDQRCRFSNAKETILNRRKEDCRALAVLAAQPHWLPFAAGQYGEELRVEDIADELVRLLRELGAEKPSGRLPKQLLFPLGVHDSDHLLTHEATRLALNELPPMCTLAYEDAVFRARAGMLQQRLASLADAGINATPAATLCNGHRELKHEAALCYASQLRGFGAAVYDDVLLDERFWKLEGGPFRAKAAAVAAMAGYD